jgi:hypothetical protein
MNNKETERRLGEIAGVEIQWTGHRWEYPVYDDTPKENLMYYEPWHPLSYWNQMMQVVCQLLNSTPKLKLLTQEDAEHTVCTFALDGHTIDNKGKWLGHAEHIDPIIARGLAIIEWDEAQNE